MPKCSDIGLSDSVYYLYHDAELYNNKVICVGQYSNGKTMCEGFADDFQDEDDIIDTICIVEWAYVNELSEYECNE